MKPEVTKQGIFSMQVCIPADWTDVQAKDFADSENPSGTSQGWFIRKDGDPALCGDDERVACSDRAGFVHIMLDC
jgi:hypothetical protein